MPLILDTTIPKSASTVALADGVDLPLPPSAAITPVFTKIESTNPEFCDTVHEDEWVIELTAHDKVTKDGETGVSESDGIILRFEGRRVDDVAIDLRSRRMYSEADAALQEEIMETQLPRYRRWDFFLTRALLTDGPARAERQHRSQEEREAEASTKLADSISTSFVKAMEMLMRRMGGPQAFQSADGSVLVPDQETMQQALDAVGPKLTPEQEAARALLDEVEDEYERERAEDAQADAEEAQAKKTK